MTKTRTCLIFALTSRSGCAQDLFLGSRASADPGFSLASCDGTKDQHWVLGAGGWGGNNTIVNDQTKPVTCLDVHEWQVDRNLAAIDAHKCCNAETKLCAKFDQNYNQQWAFEATGDVSGDGDAIGRVRVFTAERLPGKCLEAETLDGAGSKLQLFDCDNDRSPKQLWAVRLHGTSPLLRFADNTSLCMTTAVAPAPPPPAPTPARACVLESTKGMPFCDESLPIGQRARDLVGRMTLEEKATQLVGGIGGGVTPATPRLGVPAYQYHSEGLHGLRSTCTIGDHPLFSTLFPQVTGMAATGNMSLVYAMAAHMADEARAVHNILLGQSFDKGGGLNYWGPTMNVVRDPRWGRTQESVSEDPWLNGAYSSNFVRGFQGADDGTSYTKVAACCKHFYAYSLEDADGFTRHNFNAEVSPRDLAETYQPAFSACLAAKPEQVMCSYNAVNGVPTCLDADAQNGWLRGTNEFDGLIVSDCDSVRDAYESHKYSKNASQASAQGIRAGCDLDCGATYKAANLRDALDTGMMVESDLDLALTRVMTMRFRLGMFDSVDDVPYTKIGPEVLNSAAGQALALDAARESIVLLQNVGTTLPLKPTDGQTIAVIGPAADDAGIMMGGKPDYCPESTTTLFAGVSAVSTGNFHVVTDDGSKIASAVAVARSADFVVLAVGGVLSKEAHDRTSIKLPAPQSNLIDAVASAVGDSSKLVLALVAGEVVALEEYRSRFGAIVFALEGGQAAGTAFGEMILGHINPSGMLPFTMVTSKFVDEVKMSDMTMRPDTSTGSLGKTYRFYIGEVVWPFGHGLSYTSWDLVWGATMPAAQVPAAQLLKDGIDLEVIVSNAGSFSGKRIVQLYVSTPDIEDAPLRTLVALEKAFVPAGGSVSVTLRTAAVDGSCAFCVYSTDGTFSVPRGTRYLLSVGDGGSDFLEPFALLSS